MKITTFNVNGIRAAINKGFLEWLKNDSPDILCVQETKAQPEQIDVNAFEFLGYHTYINSAVQKGYSGVAILCKNKPDYVEKGIGIEEFDVEGRLIRADFGDITVVNSYFPSGTTGDIRQDVKMRYLDAIYDYISALKKQRNKIILSGDYNICHKEIDISKPENKKGVSGFLPEERVWITKFLNHDFVDAFRVFDQSAGKYTWWSYRAGARAKNLGWRIDYHMVSNNLKESLLGAKIHSEITMSDHCPFSIYLNN